MFQKDTGNELLSEINIIPLVDISLVLLIIFMVTANYIMAPSFAVDIPEARHAKAGHAQNDAVSITVSREGPVYLGTELVTTDELKKKMLEKYTDNPDISVLLSADKNVNFKNVIRVLDILSELGITKLNIAAAQEK